MSNGPGLRTDAFGGSPAPAPTPTPATPAPAPAPAASAPTANASPPAAQTNTPAAPAKPAPAAAGAKAPAQTPHMPKVGTVTAANPTGDPSKDPSLTPQPGDNSAGLDENKAKLTAHVASLGAAMGTGSNSLAEFYIAVCQASRDGVISADSKTTDVADLYSAFSTALAKSKVDYDPTMAKVTSEKQQISKLRQFAKLGALDCKFDPPKVLTRARDVIGKVQGLRLSSSEALVAVARQHLQMVKADAKSKAMTDAAIKTFLTPEETTDDRTMEQFELDELEAINKRITKLMSGTDERAPCDSTEAKRAYETLNGRILALRTKLGAEKPAE